MTIEKIRILDKQGQQRDWGWLRVNFGDIGVKRAEPVAGETSVYRVVKLQESEGPAVQVVNIAGEDGSSREGVVVVRHWPDAPELPAWPSPISRWRAKGVFGKTNNNGDIGFGMGHGDYYFATASGASSVWVADDAGQSDLITGLGMLGGTNHRHLDVYYQLLPVEQASPDLPPGQPEEPPVDQPPVEEPPDQPIDPPDTPIEDPPGEPPEVPRDGPLGTPSIKPGQASAAQWTVLIEKLDQIIALLEDRTG
jgi:hypothetical protein